MATPEQSQSAFKKMAGLKPQPTNEPDETEDESVSEDASGASAEPDEDMVDAIPEIDENAARAKYQAAADVIRRIVSQFPIDQTVLVPAHASYALAAKALMPFLQPPVQSGLTTLVEKYKALIKAPDSIPKPEDEEAPEEGTGGDESTNPDEMPEEAAKPTFPPKKAPPPVAPEVAATAATAPAFGKKAPPFGAKKPAPPFGGKKPGGFGGFKKKFGGFGK
jgi:hypothetical protein